MGSDPTDFRLYAGDSEVFPCVAESLAIPGPAGRIEAVTSCPADDDGDTVAVICHPHPLYGGTMQNKVVYYLARSLNELGLRTVRFNFRGVGASEGSYGGGDGEVDDLHAVLDWVRARQPDSEIWLAGFSFGAYVALREGCGERIARLITVAPPVNFFDFSTVPVPSCPWLLVQGGCDEVVPPGSVRQWVDGLERSPQWAILPEAGHFFHGQLTALRDALIQHLSAAAASA